MGGGYGITIKNSKGELKKYKLSRAEIHMLDDSKEKRRLINKYKETAESNFFTGGGDLFKGLNDFFSPDNNPLKVKSR